MERWGYRPSSAETEFSRHLKAGRVFTADERADFWNFSLLEIYHMYLYLDSAPCYLVYCLPKGQDLSRVKISRVGALCLSTVCTY